MQVDNKNQQQQQVPPAPTGKYIEAAALLSHVQMLESKLHGDQIGGTTTSSFGHRKAPELHLCRIPDPTTHSHGGQPQQNRRNLPIVAMMAVTERCISAQLLKESIGFSGVGAPVEVLVISEDHDTDDDIITAATMVALERPDLSADDPLIVMETDNNDEDEQQYVNNGQQQQQQQPKSLMSGGVVPITPLPRLAIIVGTKSSRIISIEFSIKQKSMQLLRRNYYVGKHVLTYFEPFPKDRLSPTQQHMKQTTIDRSQWIRRNNVNGKKIKQDQETIVPFNPTGGVTSIVSYSVPTRQQQNNHIANDSNDHDDSNTTPDTAATYLWIGFGDGTGIRLHHAGFFPSVIQKHTETFLEHTKNKAYYGEQNMKKFPSLENILGLSFVKWYAHIPTTTNNNYLSSDTNEHNIHQMAVIPIPKYHPTPLAAATNSVTPFPTSWNDAYQLGMMGKGIQFGNLDDDNDDIGIDDNFKDAKMNESNSSTIANNFLSSDKNNKEDNDNSDWYNDYEAVVYCKNNYGDVFPTLTFYTSEDQYTGRFQEDLQALLYGSLEEEKKSDTGGGGGGSNNPIAAIVGGIFGIFGGGSSHGEKQKVDDNMEIDEHVGREKQEKNETKKKGDNGEVWDPDLPFPNINRAPIDLYAGVEIHDPPRQITQCIIDPNGSLASLADNLGRVSLVDLRTKQIIRMWKGYRETTCHWLQVPQSDFTLKPTLHLVIYSRQRRVVEVWQMTHGPKLKSIQIGREAQVIGCRQMSPCGYINACYIAYSNVPFSNMNQVERIVVSIDGDSMVPGTPTQGLIDKKETSSSIKIQVAANKMNRLQQLLGQTNVECESVDVYKALEEIESLEDLAICLDKIAMSPVLEEKMGVGGSSFQRLAMSHCRQVLDGAIRTGGENALTNPHVELLAFKLAYYTQVTNAYEVLHKYETSDEIGESSTEVQQPNNWGLEAAGWTSTYLKITKRLIDEDIIPPPQEPMMFYEFAACLVSPKKWNEAKFDKNNGGYAIYLSDSSRTRRDMIARIFRPLVGDIFSFKVVDQIFESLGISHEHEYKLRCFGEWFVGLSIKIATKNAVFALNSPSIRWLKQIISVQIDNNPDGQEYIPMKALLHFCRESEDLVRSFWLATLSRQAVYDIAAEKEEQTYGKIDRDVIVGHWDTVLRKLRVCLLVSLRLYGSPLGACPVSIKSVDKEGNFSVFEWLARDELKMSHKQPEINSLEVACRISNRSFDPSLPEGDELNHWKTIQRSCLSSSLDESERAEYLVDFDDDDRLGALHLYLRPHNIGNMLLPHRVLLLAKKWGRKPNKLDILQDVVVAMRSIDTKTNKRIAYASRLEVWQNYVRPVYRAVLLGFDDVPEISEEAIGPLLDDASWLDAFSNLAAQILKLISDINFEEGENINEWIPEIEEDKSTWPPVRDCFLLKRLVSRSRASNRSSLEAHQSLIYAFRICNDVGKLTECIPSFYNLFTAGALFSEVEFNEQMEEKQHEFMQDSIVDYAKSYHGPCMDTLNMGDIDTLADLWDFDMLNVNTLFLLSMYEFGKDAAVDEVLTRSASLISVQHFVDEGLDIMCRRLNNLLNVNPNEEIKKIMGTLDADMCEWVKEKAEHSEPLTNAKFDVKIGSTHLFGLRLLSLAASADISKEERIKIHSLIVLSGTIVKVLESASHEGEKNVIIGQTPRSASSNIGSSDRMSKSDEEHSASNNISQQFLGSGDASTSNMSGQMSEPDDAST